MKFTPSPFRRRALALAVGAIVGASSSTFAAESLDRSYIDAMQEQVEVFVQLSQPSVAELNARTYPSTGRFASLSSVSGVTSARTRRGRGTVSAGATRARWHVARWGGWRTRAGIHRRAGGSSTD